MMTRIDLRRLLAAAATLAIAGTAQAAEPVVHELDIGGLTAVGDWVAADDAAADAPVVLLLHGTLAHKDQELIATLQDALAERGISSLAPSLTLGMDRREGMYDCAVPFRHTHEDAVAELVAWADWLQAQGHSRIIVAGHSRGGNQVSLFARAYPDRVERLVAIAPAVGHDDAERDRRYRARYNADRTAVLASAGQGDALVPVPGIVYCANTSATPAAVRSYLGGRFEDMDSPSVIAKLPMPVLVIAGSADTTVPEVPARLADIATGDRVRLEVIEDAGHMFLDFYTEDAADLIAEFIGE